MNDGDLRERRRDSTRREISRVAIDLVLDRGLGEVTVDDIAEAAGVSPRTFFNYFPSKKAALMPGPDPLAVANVQRFAAARDVPVIDGLKALLTEHATVSPDIRDNVRAAHELLTRYPELAPTLHESIAGFEASIVDAVAQRLDAPDGDPRARVAAAMCSCVLKIAVMSHTHESTDSLERDISNAFDAMRELLTI